MSFKIQRKRTRALLLLPLALILIGAWLLWKTPTKLKSLPVSVRMAAYNPVLLKSPVHPVKAFATPDGRVLGFGYAPAKHPETAVKGKRLARRHAVFLRWNIQSGQLERQQPMGLDPRDAVFSPDGKKMAFFTWHPQKRKQKAQFSCEIRETADITRPPVRVQWFNEYSGISWEPDSRHLAIYDEDIRVYEASTGRLKRTIDPKRWLSDSERIHRLVFSPDRKHVAVVEKTSYLMYKEDGFGGKVDDGGDIKGRLLIVSWPELKLEDKLPGDLWEDCIWTKDGKQLTALTRISQGSRIMQAQIGHYDLGTGKTTWVNLESAEKISRGTYHQFYIPYDGIAFSPDGRFLTSIRFSDLEGWPVWDTTTGQHLANMGKPKPKIQDYYSREYTPTFSRDNRYLLYTRPEGIELWDVERFSR